MMSLIFGWINFGILILVGRYGYQRFMKKPVNDLILKEEKQISDLMDTASQLEGQVKETSIDLIVQKKKTVDLFEKVKSWQKIFDVNFQQSLKAVEQVQIEIDHKNKLKSHNIALKKIQKKVLTKTVVEAEALLNKKFSLQSESQVYLDSVVGRLGGQ